MVYRVELADRAARDLEYLYEEKNVAESEAARRWFNDLEKALKSLAVSPQRTPLAPESARCRNELRHLLYGKKPHVYRIVFMVEERKKTVWVLTIRHGARETMAASDLPE